MADVNALAASAKKKLDRGDAVSEIDAIHKAIIGVGITNASDLRRLKSQVGTAFERDKHRKARNQNALRKRKEAVR